MTAICCTLSLVAALFLAPQALACCAVSRDASQVVNADQTVIILWDVEKKMQHFIRQASFKSDAGNVGFIVPTPGKPELEESGDKAFGMLKQITAPVVRTGAGFPGGCGCSASKTASVTARVEVLERKRVAGFDAVVLRAGSSDALVEWLAGNGYAYSPQVAQWAEHYIDLGWPFTALKVAGDGINSQEQASDSLNASALRISFRTEAPLFPYREPDSADASSKLGASSRLLRIYFIANEAHGGAFDSGTPWNGRKVWSGNITHHRSSLLSKLDLPDTTGPSLWWLSEFEHRWPYSRKAPGDIIFSASRDQSPVERPAVHTAGFDPLFVALVLLALGMLARNRLSAAKR